MTPIEMAISIRKTVCVSLKMRALIKIARRYEFPIALVVAVAVALILILQLPGSDPGGGLAASIEKSLKH
jgi:hypothetical protein